MSRWEQGAAAEGGGGAGGTGPSEIGVPERVELGLLLRGLEPGTWPVALTLALLCRLEADTGLLEHRLPAARRTSWPLPQEDRPLPDSQSCWPVSPGNSSAVGGGGSGGTMGGGPGGESAGPLQAVFATHSRFGDEIRRLGLTETHSLPPLFTVRRPAPRPLPCTLWHRRVGSCVAPPSLLTSTLLPLNKSLLSRPFAFQRAPS